MYVISTTMEPDRIQVVGFAEYTDLKRAGVIAKEFDESPDSSVVNKNESDDVSAHETEGV